MFQTKQKCRFSSDYDNNDTVFLGVKRKGIIKNLAIYHTKLSTAGYSSHIFEQKGELQQKKLKGSQLLEAVMRLCIISNMKKFLWCPSH